MGRRNNPVFENLLVMVNIMQKKIQRRDPLNQSSLHHLPFLRRNHPRHTIKGKNPLCPLGVVVHREGHSSAHKSHLHRLLLLLVLNPLHPVQPVSHYPVMRPHGPVSREHFVKKTVSRVIVKKHNKGEFCGIK